MLGGVAGDQGAHLVPPARLEHKHPLGVVVAVQVDGDEVVRGVQQDRLHVAVRELDDDVLVVRPDQQDALAVDAHVEVVACVGGAAGVRDTNTTIFRLGN